MSDQTSETLAKLSDLEQQEFVFRRRRLANLLNEAERARETCPDEKITTYDLRLMLGTIVTLESQLTSAHAAREAAEQERDAAKAEAAVAWEGVEKVRADIRKADQARATAEQQVRSARETVEAFLNSLTSLSVTDAAPWLKLRALLQPPPSEG